MSSLRVGVIGTGGMGTNHLGSLAKMDRVEVTAVCDIVRERAEEAAKDLDCKVYEDSNELLKDKVCDAVIIATPHYGHTTIGIAALQSGHHTLVEKPISVHKADCERLLAAYTNKELVFSAMFNQRTEARHQKIRDLINSGALGKIERRHWTITSWFRTEAYYASGGWRATWEGEGGGVLLNQCPHNLDLWQWWFGMPSMVRGFCQLGRRHNIEVEDDVTAYMEYEDGSNGVFITSTGEAPGTNRLEIMGDKARLVMEGGRLRLDRTEMPVSKFLKESDKKFASPKHESEEIEVEKEEVAGHRGILENFRDAILEGKNLIAPATDGIHSVELGNAMLYSSETGKPVNLPLDGKAYEAMLKEKIASSTFVKETKDVQDEDFSKSFA